MAMKRAKASDKTRRIATGREKGDYVLEVQRRKAAR